MEELKNSVNGSFQKGDRIVIEIGFFNALLGIMGHAIASIENGNIYQAREILSEAGEIIYQRYKSILVEE